MGPASVYSSLRLFLDGMLSMMALYALLSYFQLKKNIYWQYGLYILSMVVDFRLSDHAYALTDYRPGGYFPETLVETIAYVFYVRFAILLINPEERVQRLMRLVIWLFAGAMLIDTLLWLVSVPMPVRSGVYMTTRLIISGFGLYLIPILFRLRSPVVSYFVAGSLWLIVGSIAALLVNYMPETGPFQIFRLPVSAMQVGVVGEVLFFTLGLSLSHRQNEQEKIRFQAELIAQLQENERKQEKINRIRDDIAHDLHDDVGADLGTIGLLSQVAARQLDQQPEQARATLKNIGQTARRVVATMREIVWSMNSAQTSLESFSFRLGETATTLFEHQPIELSLDLPLDDADWILPAEGRRDLFLLAKEMLNNAIRHAEASRVLLRLQVTGDTLCLLVEDNGKGFLYQPGNLQRGNGLRSMEQRAHALTGYLQIRSTPGVGTCVSVTCPLNVAVASVPAC